MNEEQFNVILCGTGLTESILSVLLLQAGLSKTFFQISLKFNR